MAARSKLICERIHAKRRAVERYGLALNRYQYREIVALIRSSKGTFLGRESCSRTHWLVEWEGRLLRLVYDSRCQAIITFLPPIEQAVEGDAQNQL